MESLSGKIALVTGASSGIGAAICREFASHGMIVIGVDRQGDLLKVTDFSSLSHLQFSFFNFGIGDFRIWRKKSQELTRDTSTPFDAT
jgi:NAD(P)-dependent dehydrogenase (short-subunit alcohol dehydrogenase family)